MSSYNSSLLFKDNYQKNIINNRLRRLLRNPNYLLNDDTKEKIETILKFLDEHSPNDLNDQNIKFKDIYSLISQILEDSYKETVKNENSMNIDDITASFGNLGVEDDRNNNTRNLEEIDNNLINQINEIYRQIQNINVEKEIPSYKKRRGGQLSCIKKSKKNKKSKTTAKNKRTFKRYKRHLRNKK